MHNIESNMAHALDAGLHFCFIRTSLTRASDAHRYRDMKLDSLLFGWSDPDQALRVAAGILGKRASGGLARALGLLPGVRSLPDNASNLGASTRGRVRIGGHG